VAIPNFNGDEDNYEINPMEWLMMTKKIDLKPWPTTLYFLGEAFKWWM
jgi:dolichyl-phosphate-mannose--protein O-mannosyl transferase